MLNQLKSICETKNIKTEKFFVLCLRPEVSKLFSSRPDSEVNFDRGSHSYLQRDSVPKTYTEIQNEDLHFGL